MERLLDWIATLPQAGIYAVLALLSAVENVFPPVPADVAVVLGAFLSKRGEVSAPLLGVLCWLANSVTAVGMYYAGRAYGETLFEKKWAAALLPAEARVAILGAYQRHGVAGIFFTRLLPAVRSGVTPFAGVLGLSPARVLVPATAASAAWYTFLILAGTVIGDQWETARAWVDNTTRVLTVLAVAAVVAFVLWLRKVRRAG